MSLTSPTITISTPSRGRPEQIKRLVTSALDLAHDPDAIEIIVYLDEDDPCREEYLKLANQHPITFYGGPSLRPIASTNILAHKARAQWVAHFCDDVVVRSQDWDQKILTKAADFPDEIALLYAKDQGGTFNAHPIVSKKLLSVLGYVMYPGFIHYCGDSWLHELFLLINRMELLDDVEIEHLHYRLNKAEFDVTYKRSHNAEIRIIDRRTRLQMDRLLPSEAYTLQKAIDAFANDHPNLVPQHHSKAPFTLDQRLSLETAFDLTKSAETALSQGAPEKAVTHARAALEHQATNPNAMHFLGAALGEMGQLDEALVWLKRSSELNPVPTDIWSDLAICYLMRDEATNALQAAEAALSRTEQSPHCLCLVGECHLRLNHMAEAETFFLKAANAPDVSARTLEKIAQLLRPHLPASTVAPLLQKAVSRAPGDARLGINYACVLLEAGQWSLGWNHYQHRPLTIQRPDSPAWQGEDISGKTILVLNEQGFGDALLFLRYSKALTEQKGAQVLQQCAGKITRLADQQPYVTAALTVGEGIPDHDVHVAIADLPRLFATEPTTAPYRDGYLIAAKTGPALPPRTGSNRRIGLCWRSESGNQDSLAKSIPDDLIAPLVSLPGIDWYSLQFAPPLLPGMYSATLNCKDFADSAHVMSQLDLVISIDTAQAHLAGALGIPFYALLSPLCDWRWRALRPDGPVWYQHVKALYAPRPNEWTHVIEQLRHLLLTGSPAL